jgi:ketosteroid isomerase-like protein
MMKANKDVIIRLNRSFGAGDEAAILACLDEKIVWHVPPFFTARGKQEFRRQIKGPGADGPPKIELRKLVAEGDTVTVEGYVTNKFMGGGEFRGLFHNAYVLKNSLIVKMTSYVVPLPPTGWDSETTK